MSNNISEVGRDKEINIRLLVVGKVVRVVRMGWGYCVGGIGGVGVQASVWVDQ